MATAKQMEDKSADYDVEKPNHMVIWLDRHIDKEGDYMHLKKAFGSNTDPRCQTWTMLIGRDYDSIFNTDATISVRLEDEKFLLKVFQDEEACLEAFRQNEEMLEGKRIFFITSGSMGRSIVPKIIAQYPHVFTDPITNQPYASIYLLCDNIVWEMDWGINYFEYVQMFDFDSNLLERLTRDIAEYYIERSRRLREGNDLKGAVQCLYWAKTLWNQYEKMQQEIRTNNPRAVRESQRMKEIEALIKRAKEELFNEPVSDENSSSDDEGKGYEPE